jgi:hypothetical protein
MVAKYNAYWYNVAHIFHFFILLHHRRRRRGINIKILQCNNVEITKQTKITKY